MGGEGWGGRPPTLSPRGKKGAVPKATAGTQSHGPWCPQPQTIGSTDFSHLPSDSRTILSDPVPKVKNFRVCRWLPLPETLHMLPPPSGQRPGSQSGLRVLAPGSRTPAGSGTVGPVG